MVGLSYALMPDYASDAALLLSHPDDYPSEFRAYTMAALLIPTTAYIKAMQKRRLLQERYARATNDVDVFACPSYALERRPFGAYPQVQGRAFTFDDAIRYSIPFDLLGIPAISVPCGFSDDGFPVGLQLVAKAFDEPTVLRVAQLYEGATTWHKQHPALS